MRLKFAKAQIRIRHVDEFLLIQGLFLLLLFSLDRAAFWSCSRKCLRSATQAFVSISLNFLQKLLYHSEYKKCIYSQFYLSTLLLPEGTVPFPMAFFLKSYKGSHVQSPPK